MSKRRKLVMVLGAGALTAPFASFAQTQGKVWRVGFLSGRHVDFLDSDYYYGPFRQGMRELGYVEGKNLVIEWRSAEGKNDRLARLANELVALKVDLIVTAGTPATSAAQKATTTIPVVMGAVGDPVGAGFIKSLARPGANITGLSLLAADTGPKLLEMLRTIVPGLSRVAVLVNSQNATTMLIFKQLQAMAQKIGVTVLPMDGRTEKEIDKAFSMMVEEKAEAAIVAEDPFLVQQRRQIAELAAKHRLPSITASREYAEAGGLMTYGQNLADSYRLAATYVDKIFKGARPADLPVEQPMKIEMVINRKTARMLGLTIPQSLLISADQVID